MANPNYKCTQQEMYTLSRTVLTSLEEHVTDFSNFKPKYDAVFIAAADVALEAARQLPDEQARGEAAETARKELGLLNTDVLNKFQDLKSYIFDAYDAELRKMQYEAAGQDYYDKASDKNWDSTKGLLMSASTYISNRSAVLSANNNMPPTFPPEFDALKLLFETKHQFFLQAEEQERVQTAEKINANNAVYATTTGICKDGQKIFRKNKEVKQQFVIEDVMFLISGTGTAGVKGTVTDSVSGLPIEGVTVLVEQHDKTDVTDVAGKYSIKQVAAGSYTVSFSKAAYVSVSVAHEVNTGTMGTLNVQMEPSA